MRLNWTSWENTLRRLGLRLTRKNLATAHHKSRAAALEALERREMMAVEITNFHLVNDTGSSNTDHVTSDPTVSGTVGGLWSGMQAGVEFDHDGDGDKEGEITASMSGEDFTYDPRSTQPSLATYIGALNFKYRTVEYDEMNTVIATGEWQPFSITLEAPSAAEIQVLDSWGVEIPDDIGSFDFGSTPRGTNVDKTFTIRNTGTSALTINTNSFSLPNGFSLITAPAATVAANNGSTTFTVRMSGATEGVYTGSLSFTNNDADEGTFNFSISGDVYNDEPEVEVRGPSGAIVADGATFALGSTGQNQPITTTFTVHNSGHSPLNLSNLQAPLGATIISTFSTVVNANGGQTSFTVRFEATTSGNFSGGLSFTTNDTDENPYNITLTASVGSGGGGGGSSGISINNVRLFRDSGLSDTDNQTSDPRVTGSVTGEFNGGYVEVEFDHNNNGGAEGKSLVSLTGQSFTYNPALYDSSLNGYTGAVALRYRYVLHNAAGTVMATGNWTPFDFTMIPGPGAGGLTFSEFELFKDTGTNNADHVTINPAVYFVLSGDFGADTGRVEFDNDGDGAVDGSVNVSQAGIEYDYDPREMTPALATHLGSLAIYYRFVKLDSLGNVLATGAWDSFRSTIELPPASQMTVGEWALVNDTGNSSTDKITSDITFKGKALGQATQSATTVPINPEIEFDLDGNQVPDDWMSADFEKKFTFLPEFTTYGAKTVSARVKEWSDLYGTYLVGAWSSFEFQYTFDPAAPVIDLKLKNDTGTLNTDGLTRDATLTGRLDGEDVSNLKIHLDYNNDGIDDAATFADQQGNFQFTPRGLTPGTNTIKVRSSRLDPKEGGDVFGPWKDVSFTFEATPIPSATNIKLVTDTGTSSTDNKTTDPTITGKLAGDTNLINVGLEFDHDGNDQPEGFATSDGLGQFAYRPMGLGVGQQTVRARAYQWDDNLQAFVRGAWVPFGFEIEASAHVPASMTALSLYRDTGSNNADNITTDPTIIGTVFDDMAALNPRAYMTIEIDTNNDGTADTTVQTNAGGAFRYVALNQTPGTYTIQARTKEWDYTQRLGYYGIWTPITFTIVAPVNNPPVLAQLSLLGDTGSSQNDLHTANPMLTGLVNNDTGAKRLVVEFDHDGNGVGDGLAFTDEQGAFYYTPEPLSFATHTIQARPIEWDEASGSYLTGLWVPITFTYEDQPNAPAKMMMLGLLATTGTSTGDPTLSGLIINEGLLAGIVIELDFDNNLLPDQFATTDAYGRFTYTPTNLGYGSVMVHARTRETDSRTGEILYSGWSDFSFTYNQVTNAPANINQFALKNDTGPNVTDGQTTDATLTGHVNNDGSAAELSVQFDHNNDGVIDGTATTDAEGNFTYQPEGLSFAQYTIRARVKEYDPQGAIVYSAWKNATFTLQDPLATAVRVDLLVLANDSGNSNSDGSTADATLNGHVANAAGQTLTVEFDMNGDSVIDGTATTNADGNFSFVPQNLKQGYTTIRSRVASSGTLPAGSTHAGWTTVNFVFHAQPDGAEAQALTTAFHNFNTSWQNAQTTYLASYGSAQQTYRAAVQAAYETYDATMSNAAINHNNAIGPADAGYNSVVASANSALVSALISARQQFESDLASFQGDTTSFVRKDFEFPDAPESFAAPIPADQDQPLTPSDGPVYEGDEYKFSEDKQYEEDLANADRVYEEKVKEAEEEYKNAEKQIEADYESDRRLAGNAFSAEMAAAQTAYQNALKTGTNPVDLAAESQLLKQITDAETDRYERAKARHAKDFMDAWLPLNAQLTHDLAAIDAWVQQEISALFSRPDYQQYYAEHMTWPPQLGQDTLNIEEQGAQQKADKRYTFDVTVAALTRTKTEKDASALLTKEVTVNNASKAYEEKAAQHAHWEQQRKIDAMLGFTQAVAQALKNLDVALAEANRKRIERLAGAAKTHDVKVQTAAANRMKQRAEAESPPVQSRASFEQTPWWEFQKKLVDNAVQYVTGLVSKVIDKLTSDAESDRDEIVTVAQKQKDFIEQVAELRRQRRSDDAVSWRAFRSVANDHARDARIAESDKWRVHMNDRALANFQYSFDMAAAQETLSKDSALIAKNNAYAVAAANAHNTGPADRDQKLAAAQRDQSVQIAGVTHTFSYASTAAREKRSESRTLARKTYETAAHEIGRKQSADDTDSYKTFKSDVAQHARTFATGYAEKYATYVTGTNDKATETAHEYAQSEKALRDGDANLSKQLDVDNKNARNVFQVAVAAFRKALIDAWNAVLGTPWSAFHAALAQVELDRVTSLGAKLLSYASETGQRIYSWATSSSSIAKTFADDSANAVNAADNSATQALKDFAADSADARKTYATTVADKTATHDKNLLGRNRMFQDAITNRRWTRADAVNDATWAYDRWAADAQMTYAAADANITYDLAVGTITQEQADTQRAAAMNAQLASLVGAETVRRQSVALAESTRAIGEASDLRDWVKDLGDLHVQLAADIKAASDQLASDLKAASNALSSSLASAGAQLQADLANEERDNLVDQIQVDVDKDSDLAPIDGSLSTELEDVSSAEREGKVHARGEYELELFQEHASKMNNAVAPPGATQELAVYQRGVAAADVAAAQNRLQTVDGYHDQLTAAYHTYSLRLHGQRIASGGGYTIQSGIPGELPADVVLIQAQGQAMLVRGTGIANATRDFGIDISQHLSDFAVDSQTAASAAAYGGVQSETKYDLERTKAMRDYNNALADAHVLWVQRIVQAEVTYYLGLPIADDPYYNDEAAQQVRDNARAAADADYAAALRQASAAFVAAVGDALAVRTGEQGDALVNYATQSNDAWVDFASDAAAARAVFEPIVTQYEVGYAEYYGAAQRDYNIKIVTRDKELTEALGAAEVFLVQGLGQGKVQRTAAIATSEAIYQTAAKSRVANRYTNWVTQQNSTRATFLTAQATAESQWFAGVSSEYAAYWTAMAQAEIDRILGLTVAYVNLINARAAAELTRVTNLEPLKYTASVEEVQAVRQFAEDAAERQSDYMIAEATTQRTLEMSSASAVKGQSVSYAASEKVYQVALANLVEGGDPSAIWKTRNTSRAAADVDYATAAGNADVAWTTSISDADQTFHSERGTSDKVLMTELARIDWDLVLAAAPHDEQLSLAYASAQQAYWTAELAVEQGYRTARYTAIADYREANLSQQALALASLSATVGLPWAEFIADRAAVERDWFIQTGRSEFMALGVALNNADADLKNAVSVLYATWTTAIAAADRAFVVALANSGYQLLASDAASLELYESQGADADESWQVWIAGVRRTAGIGTASAERDYAENADAAQRTSALASVATGAANSRKSAALGFTVDDTAASVALYQAEAGHKRDFVIAANLASQAHVLAVSAAEETYQAGLAATRKNNDEAIANAVSDFEITSKATLASAIHALAVSEPSPWSVFADAVASAVSTYTAATSDAERDRVITVADADRVYDQVAAGAIHTLTLDLESARAARDLALADAQVQHTVARGAAENAVAQVIPYVSWAEVHTEGDGSDGQPGVPLGPPAPPKTTPREKKPAPALPAPLTPLTPTADDYSTASDGVTNSTDNNHAPPGLSFSADDDLVTRWLSPGPGYQFKDGRFVSAAEAFFNRLGSGDCSCDCECTPIAVMAPANENGEVVLVLVYGGLRTVTPDRLPTPLYLDKPLTQFTDDELRRQALNDVVGDNFGPYTPEQEAAIEKRIRFWRGERKRQIALAKERADLETLAAEFGWMAGALTNIEDRRYQLVRDYIKKYGDDPKAMDAMRRILSNYNLQVCEYIPLRGYDVNNDRGWLMVDSAEELKRALSDEFDLGLPESWWHYGTRKTHASYLMLVGGLEVYGGVVLAPESFGGSLILIGFGGNTVNHGWTKFWDRAGGINVGETLAGAASERLAGDPRYGVVTFRLAELAAPAGVAAKFGELGTVDSLVESLYSLRSSARIVVTAEGAAVLEVSDAELQAQLSLTELQGSIQDAHFLARHSPMTKLEELQLRSLTGVTPQLCPGKIVNSTRFLKYTDMEEALQTAILAARASGNTKPVVIDMGRVVGEGFYKGTLAYGRTRIVIVRFNKYGKPYTAYPLLPKP